MIRAGEYAWAAPLLDRYNRHLLRRSFASIRVAGLDRLRDTPRIVATPNHSCWWDGCVDVFLARSVVRSRNYVMMGERELARHRIFSSLGIFSVADGDAASARSESVRYIVRQMRKETSGAILWIYPQGAMTPARAPIVAQRGAAVIAKLAGARIVPVAHRYEFLRHDHPEVIVRVGEPFDPADGASIDQKKIEESLELLLRQIDTDILDSSFSDYEVVLTGAESRNERLARLRGRRTEG